jgi:hypothetical protein
MAEKVFIQIDNVVKEAKGESLVYVQEWQAQENEAIKNQLATESARKAERESAIEKLTAIGLTKSEVLALLGIDEIEPISKEI